jgi:hypothetical protein
MSRSSSSAAIATIRIDLGKNTFHLVGQDERVPDLGGEHEEAHGSAFR